MVVSGVCAATIVITSICLYTTRNEYDQKISDDTEIVSTIETETESETETEEITESNTTETETTTMPETTTAPVTTVKPETTKTPETITVKETTRFVPSPEVTTSPPVTTTVPPETTTAAPETEAVIGGYVIPVTKSDIDMIAKIVYLEARGESYSGQVAVAEVVINRVLSSNFPNTVSGVIYQRGQFSPAKRIPYTTATQTQYDATYAALTGNGVLNNRRVVYFSMGRSNGTYYTTIGCHVFGCE